MIDRAVAAAVRWLSSVRGRRIFHPYGLAYTATLTIDTPPLSPSECLLLGTARSYPAIVRFSRGIGLPQPLPDILGIALRLPDVYGPGQHQDLLYIASGNGWLLNRLLLFTGGYLHRPFSSILAYRASQHHLLFGLLPPDTPPELPGTDLTELRRLARAGQLTYRFAVAAPAQRWRAIGTLTATAELSPAFSEQLRFNPWNTGGGLTPVGFLQRLRRNAYRASQQGRQAAK